jgi:photosystem II stability/assembly factor-like uncharacterized protein
MVRRAVTECNCQDALFSVAYSEKIVMPRATFIRVLLLVIGALTVLPYRPTPATALTLHHVHGLSYSADGLRLFIPMHHGLAIYSGQQWTKAPGPEHDYMGFTSTQTFFYSSGHPAPGTPLQNPLGLMKSHDGGQTWEQLGLIGEADFHLLAASYHTNTVYVFNEAANSRMPQPGLYYTTNDGKQWHTAKGAGLVGNPVSLAVHPTQNKVVAVGTRSGVYLSQDSGASFQRLTNVTQVLAVFFALDEQHLWVSSFEGKPALPRVQWQTGQTEPGALPVLEQDAVTYIAQNPVNRQAWAIATYKRDVYVSSDNGQTWQQIAKAGETL